MTDKVSVIIPVYNIEHLVGEAINSARDQTHTNLEIIAIDDGSIDNSLKVLELMAKQDSRIKIISYNNNKGVSYARNQGLNSATGDYIAFLDSDDIWLPTKLEKQLEFLHSANCNFTNCSGRSFGAKTNEFGSLKNLDHNSLLLTFIRKSAIPAPMSCIIFKRELIKKSGYFDERLCYAEDRDFLIRLLKFACFKAFNKELVKIRQHDKNSSKKNIEPYAESHILFLKKIRKEIPVKYILYWKYHTSRVAYNISGRFYINESYLNSLKYLLICILYNPLRIIYLSTYTRLFKCFYAIIRKLIIITNRILKISS